MFLAVPPPSYVGTEDHSKRSGLSVASSYVGSAPKVPIQLFSLPEIYKMPIVEKMPKSKNDGGHGLPFWESEEVYDLSHKDGKYVAEKHGWDGKRTIKTLPVETGMRGFVCLGCEPGSGPAPFIIADIQDDKIGLVFPYVYVLKKDSEQVTVQVGGLLPPKFAAYEKSWTSDDFEFNGKLKGKIWKPIDEYPIEYINLTTLNQQYISYCVGTFGNWGLPYATTGVPEPVWSHS